MTIEKPTILVVDDVASNLMLLNQTLADEYRVLAATHGQKAVEIAIAQQPDLILLDVMMPDVDGYEACAQLKANPATRDIPIIFITALHEEADETKGLELGAIDYITKPFSPAIVRARIKNHLAMATAQVELADRLTQLELARSQLELLYSQQQKLFSLIAHDLRGPFTVLLGLSNALSQDHLDLPVKRVKDMAFKVNNAAVRVYRLLENLLEWASLQMGRIKANPAPLDVEGMIKETVELLTPNANDKQLTVISEVLAPAAYGDRTMTCSALRNLLHNAIKFTPEGGTIRISTRPLGDGVEIAVQDTGVGMAPEVTAKLFDSKNQTTSPGTRGEKGTGLGLQLAQELIALQNGRLSVESTVGQGTTFRVMLPGRGE